MNPMLRHKFQTYLNGALRFANTPKLNTTLPLRQQHATKMPLVVPGVTADNMGDNKTQEWMNKLVGKTLSDEPSSETVRSRAVVSFHHLQRSVRC
jgi:hypothetical protein